jgi:16S rRNA (adenine1518-N6/adenine1519-N6)-dimethyltransferase
MAGGLTPAMRARLEAAGFRPRRRLGQNFMRDGNMISALAREAGAAAGGLFLEPGPGAGALTAELLERGSEVVAVEIDPILAGFLRERFGTEPRLRLLEGDALAGGREVSPEVIAALGGRRFRLASNLPYSAAAAFLVALAGSALDWAGGAVTVQKEVAERLAARPGGGGYGAASVLFGVRAEAALVRRVPPDVFWPRPSVESAVVRLAPLGRPEIDPGEFPRFAAFVRAVFSARRKKMVGALGAAGLAAGDARRALAAAGLDPGERPERLSPAEFAALWRATG